MTDRDSTALQAVFLRQMRKDKAPVTIFLVNGVKLQGVIVWYDSFCVLLRRQNQTQLVYKHAISTIVPEEGTFIEFATTGIDD